MEVHGLGQTMLWHKVGKIPPKKYHKLIAYLLQQANVAGIKGQRLTNYEFRNFSGEKYFTCEMADRGKFEEDD